MLSADNHQLTVKSRSSLSCLNDQVLKAAEDVKRRHQSTVPVSPKTSCGVLMELTRIYDTCVWENTVRKLDTRIAQHHNEWLKAAVDAQKVWNMSIVHGHCLPSVRLEVNKPELKDESQNEKSIDTADFVRLKDARKDLSQSLFWSIHQITSEKLELRMIAPSIRVLDTNCTCDDDSITMVKFLLEIGQKHSNCDKVHVYSSSWIAQRLTVEIQADRLINFNGKSAEWKFVTVTPN